MKNNIFILPIGGGEEIDKLSLNITENGSYSAAEGTAYTEVTVNVPDIPAVTEPLNVTENGTYTAPEGVDGFSEVVVSVPKTDTSVVSSVESVTVLGYTSLQANIYVASNQTITSCGVEVSTTEDFAEVISYASTSNSNGAKSVHITGLTPGTTYYIRSYVIVNDVNYNQEPYNTSTTAMTQVVPESIPATATKMVTANTDIVNLKFKNKSPDEVVYIDWGDGAENGSTITASTSYGSSGGTVTHAYSEAGVYDVYIWSESSTNTTYGKMPAFYANGSDMKIARIETPLQNIYNNTSKVAANTTDALISAFRGCTSLEYVCPTLLENVHYYNSNACSAHANCYSNMFRDCTSLTTAPELPATRLGSGSGLYGPYQAMFYNCTSLTTAPELPATTLSQYCYSSMFYNCTSLTTAPELPATTLINSGYSYMFSGCTNLQSVTTYATTWRTSYTTNWLQGAGTNSENPTVYCPADSTIPSDSNDGIPSGWNRADLQTE